MNGILWTLPHTFTFQESNACGLCLWSLKGKYLLLLPIFFYSEAFFGVFCSTKRWSWHVYCKKLLRIVGWIRVPRVANLSFHKCRFYLQLICEWAVMGQIPPHAQWGHALLYCCSMWSQTSLAVWKIMKSFPVLLSLVK